MKHIRPMPVLCAGLLAACVAFAWPASGQSPAAAIIDSARVELERAAQHNDAARLVAADALLQRAMIAFPGDPYVQHYLGFTSYRRAFMLLGLHPADARALLQRAMSDLERSAAKLDWPETQALQATVLGMMISLDPAQGMELGPRSAELLDRAASKGPDNPRVLLLQAYAARSTPPEYGGSVQQAKALALRARALFAAERPASLLPRWGKEECELLIRELGGA